MRNLTTMPGITSICCLIVVSSWFLLRMAVLQHWHGAEISDLSLLATKAVLILQLLTVSLFSPFWATASCDSSSRDSSRAQLIEPLLAAIFPAWPLLAALWLLTGKSVFALSIAEFSVLGIGLGIGWVARFVQRSVSSLEVERLLLSTLGVVAAAVVWWFRWVLFNWIML